MENIKNAEMTQVESKSKLGKGLVGLIALGSVSSLMATTTSTLGTDDDSFGQLLNQFDTWLSGNLGKLLALLGFVGTFIIYLMTHKGSVLFIGIVISLIAGGITGIVETFFNAGDQAFTPV